MPLVDREEHPVIPVIIRRGSNQSAIQSYGDTRQWPFFLVQDFSLYKMSDNRILLDRIRL